MVKAAYAFKTGSPAIGRVMRALITGRALAGWFGERHLFAPTETHSRLVDRATGQSVRLDVRAKDGRLIGPDEAVILKVPRAE